MLTRIICRTLSLGLLAALLPLAAHAQCTLNPTSPSVTICAPAPNATVSSPVNVVAGTTSNTYPVTAMAIYLDGVKVYSVNAKSLNTNLTMAAGSHHITVKAWNSGGQVFSSAESITVSSGTTTPPPCTLNTVSPSVTICAPANGSTVTSPVNIVAGTTSNTYPVTAMKIYVDNVAQYSTSSSSLNTSLAMSAASHRITVQAWNSGGQVFNSTIYITVSSGSGGGTGSITQVKHIIFTFQENRSFDNYFGQMNAYRASLGLPQSVDDLSTGTYKNLNSSGTAYIYPYHFTTVCEDNISPSWNESHVDFNRYDPTSSTGLNDGFAYTGGKFAADNGWWDTQGERVMGYFTQRELPFYYYLAAQFAINDRWFSPAPTRTQPNRLYTVAATSHGYAYPPSTTLNIPTIFSELQNAGISWRVYMSDNQNSTLYYFQPFASQYPQNFVPGSQFATDAANGTLPAVAMIDQKAGYDEHPDSNVQLGAQFIQNNYILPLMKSQSWASSVFFLAFDEAGGNYDHVPSPPAVSPDGIPPQDLSSTDIPGDFTRYGFRVPNIIISPFTKPHYVSHTVMDHTAILKFIETRFGLPSLTARDGQSADMTEFFDFTNVPWKTPPTPPAQPTSAPCYFNAVP